jgi:hypothetical protein
MYAIKIINIFYFVFIFCCCAVSAGSLEPLWFTDFKSWDEGVAYLLEEKDLSRCCIRNPMGQSYADQQSMVEGYIFDCLWYLPKPNGFFASFRLASLKTVCSKLRSDDFAAMLKRWESDRFFKLEVMRLYLGYPKETNDFALCDDQSIVAIRKVTCEEMCERFARWSTEPRQELLEEMRYKCLRAARCGERLRWQEFDNIYLGALSVLSEKCSHKADFNDLDKIRALDVFRSLYTKNEMSSTGHFIVNDVLRRLVRAGIVLPDEKLVPEDPEDQRTLFSAFITDPDYGSAMFKHYVKTFRVMARRLDFKDQMATVQFSDEFHDWFSVHGNAIKRKYAKLKRHKGKRFNKLLSAGRNSILQRSTLLGTMLKKIDEIHRVFNNEMRF